MDMSEEQVNNFSVVKGHKYISLTTFRKSGTPVATPVWFVEREGKICVWTQSNSGKMKRLRHNAKMTVAPCTMRGKVVGPTVEGLGVHSQDIVQKGKSADRRQATQALMLPVMIIEVKPGAKPANTVA